MERTTLFAEVLLPLPVPGTFTYRVPFGLNDELSTGKRVVVQFGKKKIYTGLIRAIHQNVPEGYVPKYILSVLDPFPVVREIQFRFWDWIADYYMCHPGEVMNAALPSALKLASETRIVQHPDFDGDVSPLNEKEYLVAEAIDIQKSLTINEVSRIVDFQKVIPLIKTLIEKKVVLVEEEIKDKYKPKVETYVRLTEKFQDEKTLKELFDELEKRAFRQLELLMTFLQLTGQADKDEAAVKRTALLKAANASSPQLAGLEKKGVFEKFEKVSSRLETFESVTSAANIELTGKQQEAIDRVKTSFADNQVVLLHGITSSGKTEIYIKLIDEAISKGRQVLFLLPEIALTTQIINRMRKYFGDQVGVYHSKYSTFERVEIWNNVLEHSGLPDEKSKKYQIVLGARSALFLPFSNLGLIIVDEEHDTSYKQYAPAPRYHARDAAIVLAQMHGTKTLLGSATPAIESYFNAKSGKYGYVELTERYGGMELPEILTADLRSETRRKTMKSHFSSMLTNQIEAALEKKEQVILFQNRRGFSLRVECSTCHWMPECKNCDVTLIYHKHNNQLKCHYCGYSTPVPGRCPDCGNTGLQMKGFGTEKVEDELSLIFPKATIMRMDLDTTRSKTSYQKIISDFEERRIDILVGTQMVTKGLDFDNVSIVGILNADNLISYPDFRSFERSFQLMAQVSGRAGRKFKRGKVIIQTYRPNHEVIQYVLANNYSLMAKSQLMERRTFKYPPFYRMIEIQLQHKSEQIASAAAGELAAMLKEKLGNRILGPEFPIVSRIKNLYLKNILIKLERSEKTHQLREEVKQIISLFDTHGKHKAARVVVDVDPV
jgi:primosomal protein N' (replication factor Y) (superfamily II helicase)